MSFDPSPCSGSVSSLHDVDQAGRCRWCHRKVERAVARPAKIPVADLSLAYRYHFDPDFGSDRDDVY